MLEETQEQITARVVAQTATATAKAVLEAAQAAALIVARENSTALTAIAVLQTEVTVIKNQQATFEVKQATFENEVNRKLDGMSPKFDKVFEKLDGRPTWAVTIMLGGLTSLSVGLITLVVLKF